MDAGEEELEAGSLGTWGPLEGRQDAPHHAAKHLPVSSFLILFCSPCRDTQNQPSPPSPGHWQSQSPTSAAMMPRQSSSEQARGSDSGADIITLLASVNCRVKRKLPHFPTPPPGLQMPWPQLLPTSSHVPYSATLPHTCSPTYLP